MAVTITHRLVWLADAADALAVSTRTVHPYIADGQLDAVRLGRKTPRMPVDIQVQHRQHPRDGRLCTKVSVAFPMLAELVDAVVGVRAGCKAWWRMFNFI